MQTNFRSLLIQTEEYREKQKSSSQKHCLRKEEKKIGLVNARLSRKLLCSKGRIEITENVTTCKGPYGLN